MKAQGTRVEEGGSPPAGFPWLGIAVTAAGIVAVGVAVLLIDPLREAVGYAVKGDTDALREELVDSGAGIAVLLGLILVHTFVWFPAEIVDAGAGFLYDFLPALALILTGWVLQGLLAYAIGRTAARPLLYRFIGQERFSRVETAVERGGVTLLLAARLVPIVPFSLFSYVAGAAKVPVGRFVWTTAVGYLPITALFIYYGTQLHALSLSDPIVWTGLLLLIGLLLLSRKLKPLFSHPDADDEQGIESANGKQA